MNDLDLVRNNNIVKKLFNTLNILSNFKPDSSDNLFSLDQEMQNELLSETVSYVHGHIPFYKTLNNNVFDGKASHFEVFKNLPVIDRQIVHKNHIEFVNPDITPDSINCTSGTTDLKRRMVIAHHSLEFEYCNILNKIYSICANKTNPNNNDMAIVLRLIPSMRRLLSVSRVQENTITLTAMIDYDFPKYRSRSDYYDYIIQLLSSSYPVG